MASKSPPKPPPLKQPEQAPSEDERDEDEDTTPREELALALEAIDHWVTFARNALDDIEEQEPEVSDEEE